MTTKLDIFNQTQLKKDIPDIRPGDVVRVFLRLPEKTKRGAERAQVFEGLVIARKHGKGMNATFTVRKIVDGIGVERIFPLFCPSITKIEIVKRSKVRRAKLYYMRKRAGKKARMSAKGGSASGGKTKELLGAEWDTEEKPKEEIKIE
ncbi:MAG: 50S ribosomal protein L19 [Patescibacteria group bacterium]